MSGAKGACRRRTPRRARGSVRDERRRRRTQKKNTEAGVAARRGSVRAERRRRRALEKNTEARERGRA